MKEHHLKCWPVYFEALASGAQTAEVRLDDRGFEVGDHLGLQEFDPRQPPLGPDSWRYTSREVKRTISHILREHPGLAPGYVLLSFAPRKR